MKRHEVQERDPTVAVHRATLRASTIDRSSRAGYPATIALAGTSRVTMLPAPIRAFSPIVMLARTVTPDPIEAPFLTSVGSMLQSCSVCNSPPRVVAGG